MKKICCDDMRAAMEDHLISRHENIGTTIIQENDRIPINYCPWCGTLLPTGIYNSEAMTYRP